MADEIRFLPSGDLTAEKLKTFLEKEWKELQDPSSRLHQEAEARGIEIEKVTDLKLSKAIEVKQESGLDPVTATIIVAFAPVAAGIVSDLWAHVLLPRIRQHFGEDALKRDN